jgi:ATPase family associated with various cellular activities (AAA)
VTEIVLLERFFKQVHLHLVSCYGEVPQWPVILGIFGRSGDGKSAQLVASLERCEVELVRLNAADLESGLAGEPGKHLARTYGAASMAIDKGLPSALVVDDVDTTVGEWEMNTGTVNHQQVLAELMHLADRPVDPNRNQPKRVPVFVTGNNLARLYPPLRRSGRMRSMSWRPTHEELLEVVFGLFCDIAPRVALVELADTFKDETLAFFAEVRQTLREVEISEGLGGTTLDMRAFLRRHKNGEALVQRPLHVSGTQLLELAGSVKKARNAALKDFLREPDRR